MRHHLLGLPFPLAVCAQYKHRNLKLHLETFWSGGCTLGPSNTPQSTHRIVLCNSRWDIHICLHGWLGPLDPLSRTSWSTNCLWWCAHNSHSLHYTDHRSSLTVTSPPPCTADHSAAKRGDSSSHLLGRGVSSTGRWGSGCFHNWHSMNDNSHMPWAISGPASSGG